MSYSKVLRAVLISEDSTQPRVEREPCLTRMANTCSDCTRFSSDGSCTHTLQELHMSRKGSSRASKPSLDVSRSSSSSRESAGGGGGSGGGRREGRGRRLRAVEEGLSDEVERIRRRLEEAMRTGSGSSSSRLSETSGLEPPHPS